MAKPCLCALAAALVALPAALSAVGGWDGLKSSLPPSHFDLLVIPGTTLLTWLLSIVPIWFIGMTLYQRIYATRDVRTARRAWFIAGLLEWPVMASLGVILGMCGRVLYPHVAPEMGLPMLIREALPVGVVGLVMAAYFAAIMSTADSCLLASVGNLVDDLYCRHVDPRASDARVLRLTRALTVLIGIASVSIALLLPTVLEAILLAYGLMVSGLFAPTVGGLLWRRVSGLAALVSMGTGTGILLLLTVVPSLTPLSEEAPAHPVGWVTEALTAQPVDPVLLALPSSFLALVVTTLLAPARAPTERTGAQR